MKFTATTIHGVALIELAPVADERGYFARCFDEREFAKRGYALHVIQTNISLNVRKGTLRGLHYQIPPHAETKLVRVAVGAIYDVVLDLRLDSPSFKKWEAFELTAKNQRALYSPEGCAHGFQTLVDNTEVFYEMGNYYEPSAARGVRYDDPALKIRWPLPIAIISEKDKSYLNFS